MERRKVIQNLVAGAGVALTAAPLSACTAQNTSSSNAAESQDLKGNINHSVCRWCYNDIPLDELCEKSKDLGIQSVEITSPNDWPTIQKYGLTAAVGTPVEFKIHEGFNEPKFHEELTKTYLKLIDQAADAGIPNIIVFSGNRNGMDDQVGLENCAVGLETIVKHAEKKDVMLVMELLNSKVNHPDYQCDHTPWGAALVDKIGSSHFKLLYDIYHMQVMEGDVIATIRKYYDHIAHFHTGGVPGRNEINNTQELYYPAIMKAIVALGYKGYVGQEFVPTWDDKIAALKEGVTICDV